jgi:LysM repeat protein
MPSPPVPPPQTDGSATYAVKNGETVGELSARYGVLKEQILGKLLPLSIYMALYTH